MNRYICIHGHFYQPPRENPWLEDVELQDSAYPYHDWNERITEECYRQNAASRILAPDRRIIDIVNNYTQISFDFGPTLMVWLERHEPEVYESILDADRISQETFSGHGAAIAQAYNHMIMPLANARDRETQVIWGIRDFEQRFAREPEGMWLPETAVDVETLEILAKHGIRFTILAPRQAGRVRKIGEGKWQELQPEAIDTTQPYLCSLPSGRSISLFFFQGPASRSVAYGSLLDSGQTLAEKALEHLAQNPEHAQLAHIASDGETYGHHHRKGDMALAYALHYIDFNKLAHITVYGEFLERFPPRFEVEINENTSWSCSHGIGRWSQNCGCAQDMSKSGQQQWRRPLREAMDRLRDQLTPLYEKKMGSFVSDPWWVRDEYIRLVNNRSEQNVKQFIRSALGKHLMYDQRVTFLKLLEMQRNAMLMYTSCGWFFDSLSGIETLQIMQYASRTIQLAKEVGGDDLEPEFKSLLGEAVDESVPVRTGIQIYEADVTPNCVDLNRVGAHLAASSVFDEDEEWTDVYCYGAKISSYDSTTAGNQKLVIGRATVQSKIVLEEGVIDFAVLHFGDHDLTCSIAAPMTQQQFEEAQEKLKEAFVRGDTTEVIRLMNVWFGGNNYSLWHLFKDQQRRILCGLLETTWEQIEASFRQIYTHNYTIMQMMRSMGMPLPKELSTPAQYVLNHDLVHEIDADQIDVERLRNLADEVSRLSLQLDETTIRYTASRRINRLMDEFEEHPGDIALLATADTTVRIISEMITDLDLNRAQNALFAVAKTRYPKMLRQADAGEAGARQWIKHFHNVAQGLGIVIKE